MAPFQVVPTPVVIMEDPHMREATVAPPPAETMAAVDLPPVETTKARHPNMEALPQAIMKAHPMEVKGQPATIITMEVTTPEDRFHITLVVTTTITGVIMIIMITETMDRHHPPLQIMDRVGHQATAMNPAVVNTAHRHPPVTIGEVPAVLEAAMNAIGIPGATVPLHRSMIVTVKTTRVLPTIEDLPPVTGNLLIENHPVTNPPATVDHLPVHRRATVEVAPQRTTTSTLQIGGAEATMAALLQKNMVSQKKIIMHLAQAPHTQEKMTGAPRVPRLRKAAVTKVLVALPPLPHLIPKRHHHPLQTQIVTIRRKETLPMNARDHPHLPT